MSVVLRQFSNLSAILWGEQVNKSFTETMPAFF